MNGPGFSVRSVVTNVTEGMYYHELQDTNFLSVRNF